jgi:hypothetical protein
MCYYQSCQSLLLLSSALPASIGAEPAGITVHSSTKRMHQYRAYHGSMNSSVKPTLNPVLTCAGFKQATC